MPVVLTTAFMTFVAAHIETLQSRGILFPDYFAAQGFFAADGCLAAQGFFAAQGLTCVVRDFGLQGLHIMAQPPVLRVSVIRPAESKAFFEFMF
ncbi:MAG: hypothetical protein ACOYMG_12005 [Candidatus Methylumidiphilus sp.]